jgi:hypothetical protein
MSSFSIPTSHSNRVATERGAATLMAIPGVATRMAGGLWPTFTSLDTPSRTPLIMCENISYLLRTSNSVGQCFGSQCLDCTVKSREHVSLCFRFRYLDYTLKRTVLTSRQNL